MCEAKTEFPKIMSEPQLVDDQTPSTQPVKPKRVRLVVDDQIIQENEANPFSIRRSTSLVAQNQRNEAANDQ